MRSPIDVNRLDDLATIGLLAGLALLTAAIVMPAVAGGLAVSGLAVLLPSLLYGAR